MFPFSPHLSYIAFVFYHTPVSVLTHIMLNLHTELQEMKMSLKTSPAFLLWSANSCQTCLMCLNFLSFMFAGSVTNTQPPAFLNRMSCTDTLFVIPNPFSVRPQLVMCSSVIKDSEARWHFKCNAYSHTLQQSIWRSVSFLQCLRKRGVDS